MSFSGPAAAREFWPPRLGQEFPDIELIDQTGKTLKISNFKGDVLVIEYVGMNCPACQAFAGANRSGIGPYQNNAVAGGLKSLGEYCPIYAEGITLSDPRVTFVQVLLYDTRMGPPTPEDARKWAKHFRLDPAKKQYVTVPTEDMRGAASYNLIPGFQLVDQSFILRADSTGHNPKDSLYQTLLPMLPKLLEKNKR
jgi:hypothetical protein